MITLLECLRLQAETDVPLPRLKCMDPATKGKGKKRAKLDKPVPVEMYKTLVNLYVDRICIWSALQIGEDAPYNTFVEPILQN